MVIKGYTMFITWFLAAMVGSAQIDFLFSVQCHAFSAWAQMEFTCCTLTISTTSTAKGHSATSKNLTKQ